MNAPLKTTALSIALGTAIAGGFFGGVIGDRAIIVANKAEGETSLEWGAYGREIEAKSFHDGFGNTTAMATAGSELAIWAKGLRIGDHDDWYIPSRDELEVLYRNLKPTEYENYRYSGDNPTTGNYAYSDTMPGQTGVEAFQDGQAEAFDDSWYWSSTQSSPYYAWDQYFGTGYQDSGSQRSALRARAVRTVSLSDLVL